VPTKLDSANYYLDKAFELGAKNNLKSIQSESLGWKGEVQRREGNKDTAIYTSK
jgi:hypothetical protein